MEKNPDPGSGMNIPVLILRTYKIFGLKIHKFFDADPGRDLVQISAVLAVVL